MLFREVLAFYSENRTKSINTVCEQNAELLIVKAGGTYSCHLTLVGQYKAMLMEHRVRVYVCVIII
jgi:hypothetical protein